MRKLGLSIYPEKSTKEEIVTYLEKAAKYGFSRIFSCLLSVTKAPEEIKAEFLEVNRAAHALGYEVIVDVSPRVFKELGISYQDLSFFHDIEADGIRLDQGFTGLEESLMTFNPYNLKIEINMSQNTHTIDTIMDYEPNRYNVIGCHNFYPHIYSGLALDHFQKCTERFRKYGLRTAAFVTSQVEGSFGPWPVTDGLPTLEMHRDKTLAAQMKHLIALGGIDDLIISNCYPSDEELEAVGKMRLDMVTLNVTLREDIPEIMRKIVLEEMHFHRGDVSGNYIRSTQSRVKFKGQEFPLFHAPEILKRGDVIVESSLYGHYAGELQIAMTDMKNSGKSNVVGRVAEEEIFLLDALKPWQKFNFSEK
ncbi:DUF871 domain-containing protein [Proteiniclasticum sp. BAD-10]|uniref:DUF871 domain-containing protein n=1 Tax=Proteiniclasticum sediminis TaxID=2804028 RepID=A0A941CM34_9CLOT|nr:MupG family TIM beta-alpha barrel fold protein [Proteiniclasticum sediminis]MBR0575070.1 DUF871 domain-containing protein [Proteiniclasticum sediminis]